MTKKCESEIEQGVTKRDRNRKIVNVVEGGRVSERETALKLLLHE